MHTYMCLCIFYSEIAVSCLCRRPYCCCMTCLSWRKPFCCAHPLPSPSLPQPSPFLPPSTPSLLCSCWIITLPTVKASLPHVRWWGEGKTETLMWASVSGRDRNREERWGVKICQMTALEVREENNMAMYNTLNNLSLVEILHQNVKKDCIAATQQSHYAADIWSTRGIEV